MGRIRDWLHTVRSSQWLRKAQRLDACERYEQALIYCEMATEIHPEKVEAAKLAKTIGAKLAAKAQAAARRPGSRVLTASATSGRASH